MKDGFTDGKGGEVQRLLKEQKRKSESGMVNSMLLGRVKGRLWKHLEAEASRTKRPQEEGREQREAVLACSKEFRKKNGRMEKLGVINSSENEMLTLTFKRRESHGIEDKVWLLAGENHKWVGDVF